MTNKSGTGGSKSRSGRKGVSQETIGSRKEKDPDFADTKCAAAAGRKGGHTSH